MSELLPQNRRILLVDDHRPIHDDFRSLLSSELTQADTLQQLESKFFGAAVTTELVLPHYELDSAYQGQEAVEKVRQSLAQQTPYALVFMDVRMPPGWDGIETVRRIWALDPALQVVICTAYADYTWEEIYKTFGWTDNLVFMRKPFDHTEVRQVACAMTRKWNYALASNLKLDELNRLVEERTQRLTKTVKELEEALANVRTLNGLIPICAWCKKVREDEGYWHQVEQYVSRHTAARFSHGICPECARREISKAKSNAGPA